jgi:hypothetical protein
MGEIDREPRFLTRNVNVSSRNPAKRWRSLAELRQLKEEPAQLLRHALIEEDAHEISILGDSKKPFPGLREQLMHLRFRDRREICEKIRNGMTAIHVIEQRLHGYAGPGKARRPAHDLGVNGDDAGFHADKLAGGMLPARFDSRGL